MDSFTIGAVRLTTYEAEVAVGKMGHIFAEALSHGVPASELGAYWGSVLDDMSRGKLLLPKSDIAVMENIFRFFWGFFQASADTK